MCTKIRHKQINVCLPKRVVLTFATRVHWRIELLLRVSIIYLASTQLRISQGVDWKRSKLCYFLHSFTDYGSNWQETRMPDRKLDTWPFCHSASRGDFVSALWSNSIPTIHVFVVHFREDSILSGLSSFGFELDFNIFRPRKGGTLDRPVPGVPGIFAHAQRVPKRGKYSLITLITWNFRDALISRIQEWPYFATL